MRCPKIDKWANLKYNPRVYACMKDAADRKEKLGNG